MVYLRSFNSVNSNFLVQLFANNYIESSRTSLLKFLLCLVPLFINARAHHFNHHSTS